MEWWHALLFIIAVILHFVWIFLTVQEVETRLTERIERLENIVLKSDGGVEEEESH